MTIPSATTPSTFNDILPAEVEVVVIGGGVIGISIAWCLSRSGVSVAVCEKGRIAGEQSSRNWGWVRQQGRDAAELPIMMNSIDQWEAISREITVGFSRHGTLYLARNEEELAGLAAWLDTARQCQLDSRILSASEVDELITDQPGHWVGALHTPSDGRAEPFIAVPAMAGKLRTEGVPIREQCAVRSIDTSAGNVRGVITEHGPVRAQSVVLAGGAWSSVFLGNLGVRLPQLTVRGTVARIENAPDIYAGNASGGNLAFRRREDGGYTVAAGGISEHFLSVDSFRFFDDFRPVLQRGARKLRLRLRSNPQRFFRRRHWNDDEVSPFEQQRILNPPPSADDLARIREGLTRFLPCLADLPFAQTWGGMIDVMPDVVPVMDEVPGYPGLFLATGFSGHGFGIGPGAGQVMADMVLGKPPAYDLSRFRLSRFGGELVLGPGL